MAEQERHAELIKGIAEQMKILLKESERAIYIYLDDTHKVCNKKFADLLGYKSPRAWADAEAPLSDVLEEDQQKVIDAYMNASEKGVAGSIDVKMQNIKTEEILKVNMIVAPTIYEGHIFTVHFVSTI
jgi:Mn-dependent DtxR family transcriptional regulator